jgi:hypothetical protein
MSIIALNGQAEESVPHHSRPYAKWRVSIRLPTLSGTEYESKSYDEGVEAASENKWMGAGVTRGRAAKRKLDEFNRPSAKDRYGVGMTRRRQEPGRAGVGMAENAM